MADENRPYIGYRSAGRRPESQQDRRASADAPLAALRGMVSGVLGAPGDIESLVRMLPGLNEQTVLPTSEDVERRLPLRSASETPVGRAATGMGTLGGGFYSGPGSPLRAMAALPSAVRRAGADFAMAAGQPAVNVVKPKGGNWLSGTVERVVEPMRPRGPTHRDEALILGGDFARLADTPEGIQQMASNEAIGNWLNSKLAKYMRNEMATPEDPLRALAERGVLHYEPTPTGYSVAGPRVAAGFPEEGMGQSDLAKRWEKRADTFFNQLQASDITRGYPELVEKDPWLLKVPPETRVYELLGGANEELGMQHLVDELRNAINPASGLPENLRWKYSDLDKVTVPQAVERVAKINEWRAAQKAEADMARAMNPATQVVKEYPEQGFKWVELKQPEIKELPSGYSVQEMDKKGWFAVYGPDGRSTGAVGKSPDEAIANQEFGRQSLEDALKYEGETMGHCVGGYCEDVASGRSKIFSLRDKKGQPHVTIEVAPSRKNVSPIEFYQSKDVPQSLMDKITEGEKTGMFDDIGAFDDFVKTSPEYQEYLQSGPPEIVQIKGKANRAPNPEYLPAVQDFVRSGNWSNVGDLKNTGLIDLDKAGVPNQMRGGQRFVTQDEYEALVRKNAEGFSLGGLVQKYAEGGLVMNQANIYGSDAKQDPASAYKFADGGQAGSPPAYAEGGLVANSPTVDFDPARIDAIVGELHAMNAG